MNNAMWIFQGRKVYRKTIELAMRMVNKYKYHCKETGFYAWKDNTPDYIKQLDQDLLSAKSL